MTDLYSPGSRFYSNASVVLSGASGSGQEPATTAENIADAQLADYTRLTDPSTPYDRYPIEDRGERSIWLNQFTRGMGDGQYQLVTADPVSQSGMVRNPVLVDRVTAEVAQRNTASGQSYRNPRIAVDAGQEEPFRYDRPTDTVYANPDQLGNVDGAGLSAAMGQRYDRSPERLRGELVASAREFADQELPPAWQRAANRVHTEQAEQRIANNDPRMLDGMVEASYPLYRDATDPANPEATRPARETLMRNSGVTEATSDTHPELLRTVSEGTQRLNAEHGQNYAPPQVVLVEGLAHNNDGTPAQFDKRTDTVQLDADYARSNPQGINSIVGHELGHRYQRDPQTLQTQLRGAYSDQLGLPVDSQSLASARNMELAADREGALVAGGGDVARGAPEMRTGLQEARVFADSHTPTNRANGANAAVAQPQQDDSHPTDQQRYEALDRLISQAGGISASRMSCVDPGDRNDVEQASIACTPGQAQQRVQDGPGR